MKKYSFLPILALVLGIAASAFTEKGTESFYFRFTPNSSSAGTLVDENYQYIGTGPSSSGCDNGDLNCVIEITEAPDQNGHPDLNAAGITTQSQLDAVTVFWKDEQ